MAFSDKSKRERSEMASSLVEYRMTTGGRAEGAGPRFGSAAHARHVRTFCCYDVSTTTA